MKVNNTYKMSYQKESKIQLICVNVPTGYEELLTKGKIYTGLESYKFYYNVSNDRAGNDDYLKCENPEEYIPDWCIFITLEQWRNIQINKVLCL
jgi:hypothetical protein